MQAALVGVAAWAFSTCIDNATADDAEFAVFVLFGDDDVAAGEKSECIDGALLAVLPQLVPRSPGCWVLIAQILIRIDCLLAEI